KHVVNGGLAMPLDRVVVAGGSLVPWLVVGKQVKQALLLFSSVVGQQAKAGWWWLGRGGGGC
ncbi:hypothetical protein Dimus_010103, partial [Dionaea muscipula]